MTIETWALFFAAYFLVTLSPGPNVLLVITHAMKFGFSSILVTISANLLCQLAIVIAVATGLGALMTVDSVAFRAVKYLGAAYLVYLGLMIILSTLRSRNSLVPKSDDTLALAAPVSRRFTEAFFVSAGNPKTVVFLAAFLPQFVDPTAGLPVQFAEMFLTIAVIVLSVHAAYAWIAISVKRRVLSRRIREGTSYASGGLFVALGAGLSMS